MTPRAGRPAGRRGRVARALFVVADAPVVAAVAVGLAAWWVPPGAVWWPQLVATGLPYAAWALVALTGLALVLRWRAALVLHAVLLAAVLVRVGPLARLAGPDPAPGDLRLTTFNLPETGPSREMLADSAVAFVEATRPDLLLLQDTWVDRVGRRQGASVHVEAIEARAPYAVAVPAAPTPIAERDPGDVGVPVLVREGAGVEVLALEQVVPPGGPDVSLALRAHLRWDGRELVLYNVHLRSFGSRKPWEDAAFDWNRPATWTGYLRQYRRAYTRRAAETDHLARRIESEALPVVVAGDFNSTPDNWSTRRLQTAGARRRDAFHRAGLRWGRTYHAARPLVRIDLVLADPALRVAAAEVRDVGFSDHRPVLTRLRWSDGPAASGRRR